MNKLISQQSLFKTLKTISKLSEIDHRKRALVTGLGTLLAACTAPQPEQEQEETKKFVPVSHDPQPDMFTEGQGTNDNTADCRMCPPGVNPPIGLPNIPPDEVITPAPAPVNPADPTPVNPAPADPALPVLAVQTYKALGPNIINVKASDMMGGITQTMADGTPMLVWGFMGSGGGSFNGDNTRLCPGPVFEMIEGAATSIAFVSTHPHTIHLHGLDVDQANDGVPSTSGYIARATPPGLIPPRSVNIGPGGIFEYRFTAPHAGTYLYHCHVDTVLHMEMGMAGTIIVRPPDGSKNALYDQGPVYDREYIWQLHTFDSTWHDQNSAVRSGPTTIRYTPDYFMINGRDGADILQDSTSSISAYPGQNIVIRLVNIGYMPAIVKLGDIPFDILCADGRPLKAFMLDLVTEWLIAPGERYDIMFTMPQSGVTTATVDYLDIQGRNILGTAVSSITTL